MPRLLRLLGWLVAANLAASGASIRFEPSPDGREFYARGQEYGIHLHSTGADLVFGRQRATAVRMSLAGANADAAGFGDERQPGATNYLVGADPTRWRRSVAGFSRVRYQGVYRGIDALYYDSDGRMEFDFAVSPGA